MAMEKFRSSPLPTPPQTYDSIYMRQLIQVLELYFGRLDSQTPVQAEYFKSGNGYKLGDISWTSGTGSPEAVVTANIGSLYSRLDGGAGTTLYVKESGTGNTGWSAV